MIRMACVQALLPSTTLSSSSPYPPPLPLPLSYRMIESPLWEALAPVWGHRQCPSSAPTQTKEPRNPPSMSMSVIEVWISFSEGFSTVHGDCRLVFSWPLKVLLGPHPAASAKAAQGSLWLGRPLGSPQPNPFEGKDSSHCSLVQSRGKHPGRLTSSPLSELN